MIYFIQSNTGLWLRRLTLLFAAYCLTIANAVFATVPCTDQAESLQPCMYELPAKTIEKLQIDAGFGWGIFSGTIYNGNSGYAITQLKVTMEPIHDHHHMEMMGDHPMLHETKTHAIKMHLQPLSKSAISMALPEEDVHVHDFKWNVIQAFGYAVP